MKINFWLGYSLLFALIKLRITNATCNSTPIANKYMSVKSASNFNMTLFSKFTTFAQLIPECNHTYNVTNWLAFYPSQRLLLDKSFDLGKMFETKALKSLNGLFLQNLKGIDIQLGRLFTHTNIIFGMSYSRLDLFSNNEMIAAKNCDETTFNNSQNFFSSFQGVAFNKVLYSTEICPLVFKNSPINGIKFADITNSFLTRNHLKFTPLIPGIELNVNDLTVLQLNVYYMSLDKQILHRQLFASVRELKITHVLLSIQFDLLSGFKRLKNIDFQIDNLKSFFHADTKWMSTLNSDINVDLGNVSEISANLKGLMRVKFQYPIRFVSFDTIYEYPEEDICLFRDFPHSHLVYPILKPGKQLKCTCTLAWLQMYTRFYESVANMTNDYSLNYEGSNEFMFFNVKKTFVFCSNTTVKCDFASLFTKCDRFSFEPASTILKLNNDVDVYYLIKWLQFVLLTILQPIFALLGIINNLLTIIVIKNKRKRNDFKDPMYHHILLNAGFNIAYCLIMALKLINTCIFDNLGGFCSSYYHSIQAQYFKIVCIHFLGNVFKLSSNISYLSFTFSRFILISNLKSRHFFKKFTNIRMPVYFVVCILLSCIISIYKLFQYRPNEEMDLWRDFPYEIRDEQFCSNVSNSVQCKWFSSLKIINKFLIDVLSVILIIGIDLCLLKNYYKHLENKLLHILTDSDHHRSIQKSKKNINRMILWNSFIYLLAHLPEFVSTILLIQYATKISNFCNNELSCDLINEEAEFFSLLSIVGQFFIFWRFNKNFRTSLRDMIGRARFLIEARSPAATSTPYPSSSNVSLELINLNNLIGDGKIN